MSHPFFWRKLRKPIINLSSAEFAQKMVKTKDVKIYCPSQLEVHVLLSLETIKRVLQNKADH